MSAPAPSMFSPAATEVAQRLGLVAGRPNLEVFAETLLELAQNDRRVVAVTSDSRGSGKLGPFALALPEQLVEVGIAEQNLVGISAGLASAGKRVFAVSPACFLTARALEQIKNDVCYSDNPVRLVGISAGVSYGALGSTHHSIHDLAALRAINNIEIVVPADNFETSAAIRAAAERPHPVYLRFGKAPMYGLPCEDFEIGRARVVREGNDVAFIACGETVVHALLAAAHLDTVGISARVLSMHTIKPLDDEAVCRAARECGAIITVEEHMCHGGLGEACASVLMQRRLAVPFRIVAIPDEYTVTGSQSDIFRHYGISMEGLTKHARQLLDSRRLEVRRGDLLSPIAQKLIFQLNDELSQLYPEEGANFFRLDAEEVAEGAGVFVLAYLADIPVGCGAVRRLDFTTAEIKRMYVVPAGRCQGVGGAILAKLEQEARGWGARRLVLETGTRQPEALAIYRRAGFVEVPLFGEYAASPCPELSICMAKDL